MLANRLGEKIGVRSSYLIPSKTVSGAPSLKIDQDRDHNVGENDPAVVVRLQSEDGSWQWKPVKDAGQLASFMKTATAQEKRENIGLWQDKKAWVFGKPDGVVQDHEVQTMGDRWDTPESQGTEDHFDRKNKLVSAYRESFAKVDSSKVRCEVQAGATGTLVVLEEPMFVGESHTHLADRLRLHPYGGHWFVDSWKDPIVEKMEPKPLKRSPDSFSFPVQGSSTQAGAAQPPFLLNEFTQSHRELVGDALRNS